jgi:drug/metabolite transporter (DMT)-like permease
MSFAVMNLIAKDLSMFPTMQIVFFRAFGTFIFMYPYMLYKRIPVLGNNPKLLTFRAVVGLISLTTFFMAMQRIPLGSAIAIRYLGPIFGAIMAFYFLKERISAARWTSFAIAFAGVVVMKGFDSRIDNYSLSLIMISAITVGMVFVMLRYLGDKEHHLTIINYFMVFSVIASLFSISTWVWPAPRYYFDICGIGVFGLIGQVLMTQAFQTEEASVLAPFKYMELVYALILSYFVFGEIHGFISFLGMGLIMAGMLLNVFIKKKEMKV